MEENNGILWAANLYKWATFYLFLSLHCAPEGYLKQQNLSPFPLLPPMQEIQGDMDGMLSRNDLRDEEKAK